MNITIIGAGAMGGTTAEGLLKQKKFDISLTVSDPSQVAREKFSKLGVRVTADNMQAVKGADIVIVVVKPWLVEQVLKDIKNNLSDEQLLIVIAAGVPSAKILEWTERTSVVLCIPNIAIAQLASMTFLVPVGTTEVQSRTAKELFDALGTTLITDEQHLSAGTTLASCGIAYAMRYIRAASEGGVELGFKADDAKQIVMQTVEGAVKLLLATGLHPEQAIDLVTTPGGLTIKGLNEMEHAGFTSSVIKGLKAGMK